LCKFRFLYEFLPSLINHVSEKRCFASQRNIVRFPRWPLRPWSRRQFIFHWDTLAAELNRITPVGCHFTVRGGNDPRLEDATITSDLLSAPGEGRDGDLHWSFTWRGLFAPLCSGGAQFQAPSYLSGRSGQLG
jgi:hypothetical protein